MSQGTPDRGQQMRDLRRGLVNANDRKITQIVAILDDINNPAANQAVLDPIRSRLRSLKLARPLRFARLLCIPIEPLIVPARDWRPGGFSVPRTAMAPLARVVRAGLGSRVAAIEPIIAGHKTDAVQVVTLAGDLLWPDAAEILAVAVAPIDWPETGLRPEVFTQLALCVAAILRRASPLRRLARQGAIGVLAPDEQDVSEILLNIATEPLAARAMIIRLVLEQSPHATPLLRRIVASGTNAAEKLLLQQAILSATDNVLDSMESGSLIADEISRGSLADAGDGVRRVVALLEELESQDAPRHRPRLRAIQEKLDRACRERFANGIRDSLVAPLAGADGPVDQAGQVELETWARDLRVLETTARKIGSRDAYDQMLPAATDALKAAVEAGTLTPMRMFRLIEILAGADAAEAYLSAGGPRGDVSPASGGRLRPRLHVGQILVEDGQGHGIGHFAVLHVLIDGAEHLIADGEFHRQAFARGRDNPDQIVAEQFA